MFYLLGFGPEYFKVVWNL